MQLPDNALTQSSAKRRPLTAGRWWRWSRYELRDGYLRPAPGARLCVYDPWRLWLKTRPVGRRSDQEDLGGTPYRALLGMLDQLEYSKDSGVPPDFTPAEIDVLAAPLTTASVQTILDWCAQYGLLGILPHRVLQVFLPPQAGRQSEYQRIGVGWLAAERDADNPLRPILEPHAIVQPLRGVGLAVEPLSQTWARFFPDVPVDERETFAYPQPLTEAFWQNYAEPLADFLSGARALRELLFAIRSHRLRKIRAFHAVLTGGLPVVIDALLKPVGLVAPFGTSGRPGLNWVGNSLLASLTLMLLEDLSRGRLLQCPCGQLFVSPAYQARYCSRRCRWRFEQQQYRKGRKKRPD